MRSTYVCLLSLVTIVSASRAAEPAPPAPAAPVLSPFDKEDPEIQQIRKLDWKSADFEKLDARNRCAAFFAMNKGLSVMGAKADARLDLLLDYIDKNELGGALADAATTIPAPPAISYSDFQKMAAAFVASPDGRTRIEQAMGDIDDASLPAYARMYENSSRRAFDEVVESRHQVRLIAAFLDKQGRLDQFKTWAGEEKQRRQEAHAKELAQKRAQDEQAEAARRTQAIAAAQEKQRQQAELAARQMEYAMQTQTSSGPTTIIYDDDDRWHDTWYPWTGAYYANAAYRAQVRDRAQNSWQRWRENNPRPTPRRR